MPGKHTSTTSGIPRHEHVHENERPGVADLCAHSSLLGRSGKTMAWRLPQYEIPGTTAVLSSTRSQIMSCGACRKIPCETKPNPKPPRPRHATRRLQTSDESGTALWSHQRHFRPAIDVESAAMVCSEPSPHNRRSYLMLCGVGPRAAATCGRCPCSTATAGASRGPSRGPVHPTKPRLGLCGAHS